MTAGDVVVWLAVGWFLGVVSVGLALFVWSLIMDSREQQQ